MKILFIFPQIPYPPHSGGRIVTWNTFKRFAESHEVSLVCLYHNLSEIIYLDYIKKYCHEAAAFPAHGKWSLTPFLKCLFSRKPYKAYRFFNHDMFLFIQNLINREKFDVIHAQNFYTAAYVSGKEKSLKIHYKENIEGNLLLRYAVTSKNPIIKLAAWLEGHRTRRYEVKSCRKFDQILTISPIDRDTLLDLELSLQILHQKPGVDLNDYPIIRESKAPINLIFTGTMSYYPNADGVKAFLNHTWPIILKEFPHIHCTIVGANPPESILQLNGQHNIRITGQVENISEYLRAAHIYIVPLRIGGGIRLKILEAMASGLVIVSTPTGCEGLDVKHNQNILIADMPDEFAAAVIQLIRNPQKRIEIRNDARRLVKEEYDWDKVIHSQMALYRSLLFR